MKVNVPLPFDWAHDDEMLTIEAVQKIGATLDKAGFNAALVTDHPVPTGRWLDAGGHEAHDAFVTLSLIAGATRTCRLQTGILVLPYRNPFIVARAAATLDRFSGGRLSLSFGAGYLKGEYKALGVDFERRNELMDEYMKAMRLALSGEEFTFEGSGYTALGNRIVPGPIQTPLPLYVGGNSRRAIRRVAELADGWNPFFTVVTQTATTRTAAMEGEADLIAGIQYLHEHCATIGRTDLPEVVLGSVTTGEKLSNQQIVDRIGRYQDVGVSAVAISLGLGNSTSAWCDEAERVGEEVIAKL